MKDKLPPLQGLYYFHVAAKHGSIKSAAEALFVTPAAISQQIRQLEAHLQCELFQRQHRLIELTEEGRVLFSSTDIAFEALKQGVTKLSQDPEPNRLAISTHPTFAQHWLIPRIHRFQEQNPELNIFIDPTNRLVDFSKDPVDVAIRYGEGNYESLQSVWLMDELLYPAVHPSYQARFGIKTLDDLKHGGLLEDIVPDMDWHTFFAKLGLSDPTISMMFDGSQYIVEAALAGQGVALVKHSLATRFIESKHLVRIGDKGVKSLYSYYFCTANAYKKREKVERFLSWLREEIEHFQQGQNVNLTQLRCDRESVITIPS